MSGRHVPRLPNGWGKAGLVPLPPIEFDEFEAPARPLVPQSATVIMVMGLAAALAVAALAIGGCVKILLMACQYGCPA